MIDKDIIKDLDGADVFLRNRANSKPAPLNEYDIETLLDIAKICDKSANIIKHQSEDVDKLKTECDSWHREAELNANEIIKLQAKAKKIRKNLKYYLDTNEENGVVYIPKFVIENRLDELKEMMGEQS